MHKTLVYLKGFAKGKEYWEMLKAIQVAIKLHEGQKRKTGEDYIEHPMKVTSELVALKLFDEDLLVAAILHDVIEDCEISKEELVLIYKFNEKAVLFVDLLSKSPTLSTQGYYSQISKHYQTILIKLADRCHNISTMAAAFSLEKMKEYIKETNDFVIPLCKYGINYFPEYSDEIFVMRYHIQSIISTIEPLLKMLESK